MTPSGSFLKKSQLVSFKLPQVKAYSSYKDGLTMGKKDDKDGNGSGRR